MNRYELVFITDPEKSDEQVAAITEETKGFIEKESGKVDLIEQWGKRKLAYAVKKKRYGFYTLIHYSSPPEVVSKLELRLKHHESVIKYITLKFDERSAVRPPQVDSAPSYGSADRQDSYRRD